MSALHDSVALLPMPDDQLEPGAGNPLVQKLRRLATLSAEDVNALDDMASQPCHYGANVDLIREDAVPDDVVLVLEGFACRYRQRHGGQRQITAFLLPGDLCDVDAPYLGYMDHAVGTLSPCLVVRIPRHAFAEAIAGHPNIVRALRMAKLAEEATAREWIVNLGRRSALERMAYLFCELMTRFEAVGLSRNSSCPLPLTQRDLSDTLGLSNVYVNRTLQDLRRQGLIELGGKTLRLLKPRRLAEVGEYHAACLRPRSSAHGYAVV